MTCHGDMMFETDDGLAIPSVTATEMREVDRIAVEEYGLGILQMMENAGRSLAGNVMEMLTQGQKRVVVLVGPGGNGGGGLCCARHLMNRGFEISPVLSRDPALLSGAAAHQWHILQQAGVSPSPPSDAQETIMGADLVVDALLGYSLRGAPSGRVEELISLSNTSPARVVSLDVPSGLDATTGEIPGASVRADRVLTLALPKTGLHEWPGEVFLADIGIPSRLYDQLGLEVSIPFGSEYWLRLHRKPQNRIASSFA